MAVKLVFEVHCSELDGSASAAAAAKLQIVCLHPEWVSTQNKHLHDNWNNIYLWMRMCGTVESGTCRHISPTWLDFIQWNQNWNLLKYNNWASSDHSVNWLKKEPENLNIFWFEASNVSFYFTFNVWVFWTPGCRQRSHTTDKTADFQTQPFKESFIEKWFFLTVTSHPRPQQRLGTSTRTFSCLTSFLQPGPLEKENV